MRGKNSYPYGNCIIKISEVIKGKVDNDELSVYLDGYDNIDALKVFLIAKNDILVFLRKIENRNLKSNSKFEYVHTSLNYPFSMFGLEKPPPDIFGKENVILTDGEQILNIVKQWSNSTINYSLLIEVNSSIHKILYMGSKCYLNIPAEEKYRDNFMKIAKSESAHNRSQAVHVLRIYPGKETEDLLKKLLEDDTEQYECYPLERINKVVYHLRKTAYESLKELGVTVPGIVLEREPTEEEKKKHLLNYWRESFIKVFNGIPDNWSVVSVELGKTRKIENIDTTEILVNCINYSFDCKFILLPSEWELKELQNAEYLGINGKGSQGYRHFFLQGILPDDIKQTIIRLFGLKKNP